MYIKLCNTLKDNRRFGGTCRLNFRAQRISQARKQHEAGSWFMLFLVRLISRPWIWRRHVPPKRQLSFSGLHSVISQKMKLFTDEYFGWIFPYASILLWYHLYENNVTGQCLYRSLIQNVTGMNPTVLELKHGGQTEQQTQSALYASVTHIMQRTHNNASSNTEQVFLISKIHFVIF
jgi:hypothetical protein